LLRGQKNKVKAQAIINSTPPPANASKSKNLKNLVNAY
jgi:hypothetical protein